MNKLILVSFAIIVLFFKKEREFNSEVRLLDIEISAQSNYMSSTYPKKKFEHFFQEKYRASFPEELKLFKYYPDMEEKEEIFYCEKKVRELRNDYSQYCKTQRIPETDKGYKNFWEKGLSYCHLKYMEASPIVNFKFHNIGSHKVICDSIFIFVYSTTASYAEKKKYFSNLLTDQEAFVVNPDLLYVDQRKAVSTKIATEEAVFSIPLLFLSEEYWLGNFDKNLFILKVKFSFVDNENGNRQIVDSAPFCLDI